MTALTMVHDYHPTTFPKATIMKRRDLLRTIAAGMPGMLISNRLMSHALTRYATSGDGNTSLRFQPTWESLKAYKTPAWYQDAKFGIWAHWGAQCQPENGDWYARAMYEEGGSRYTFHLQHYGHPSQFGFKDVIHEWKAERWDPDHLVGMYKQAGARFFVGMANHHDNFDNYNSTYQPWNSVRLGPHKDIVGGWAAAAKKHGLRFGVSIHAAHAWLFYETAQRSDKKGPLAGVPYDGKLRKEDGKGTWWEGYDPQDLYAQNHPLSLDSETGSSVGKQWAWGNGAAVPDKAYCEKFFNRTIELIDRYAPDLVYFDDTALPLWPVSDVGLRIAAHLYNRSIEQHGSLEAVLNGKVLDEEQRKCMVWDIERGRSNTIEPFVWQTDTCIGSWHYDRAHFNDHSYRSAKDVIHGLVDIVSKNGVLLLNIPVRGDGTIDADEMAIVEGIGAWMKINGEAIYGTRPWKVFGEGPAQEAAKPIEAQGFNESGGVPFSGRDFRFTTKGDTLYAIGLGRPEGGKAIVKSLASGSPLRPEPIRQVELLGGGALKFGRHAGGLEIELPEPSTAPSYALTFRIV
jgi:alpha-L-fucosidase